MDDTQALQTLGTVGAVGLVPMLAGLGVLTGFAALMVAVHWVAVALALGTARPPSHPAAGLLGQHDETGHEQQPDDQRTTTDTSAHA